MHEVLSRSWPTPGADDRLQLRMRVFADGPNVVAEVTGVVDRHTAPQLAAVLADEIRRHVRTLVVDLSGVTVSGRLLVGALARVHALLQARHARLYLIVGNDEVFEQLHVAGFDRMVPTFFTPLYRARVEQRAHRRRTPLRVHGATVSVGPAIALHGRPSRVNVSRT